MKRSSSTGAEAAGAVTEIAQSLIAAITIEASRQAIRIAIPTVQEVGTQAA
jgi:hypothetical protein